MAAKLYKPLSLGFSPCPNDTFIFHALIHGLADEIGLDLAQPTLADVESLNEWALQARLDVTKISFHALGHVLDDYVLLHSGSALGRGCGPLLIANKNFINKKLADLKVAIPGRYTTASMLLRMYAPQCKNLVPMRFDEIMPALAKGEVDAGVIIHESRFTYQNEGFILHQDLGTWWEETSGCPIPLGGIVARRSLGREVISLIDKGIKSSIQSAFANPQLSKDYIRINAQEMDEQVTGEHIKLYVNDFSLDLGSEGINAVKEFLERGRAAGILPDSSSVGLFVNM